MLLEVRDVWYSYPGSSFTLRGVSLGADKGEVVAIIGPVGCGKTTLLMVASGLIKPHRGVVLFRGKLLEEQLPRARRSIGVVFQDPNDQLFNPTVYDELAFSLRQLDYSEGEIRSLIGELARRFNLEDLLDKSPYKLSAGEKKMVALASILIYEPELLFLDEPTSNLSAKFSREIKSIILEMRESGKSIVVASHDIEFVMGVADRVYVMSDGAIIGGGSIVDVICSESLLMVADMELPLVLQVLKALKVDFKSDVLLLNRGKLIGLLKKKLC